VAAKGIGDWRVEMRLQAKYGRRRELSVPGWSKGGFGDGAGWRRGGSGIGDLRCDRARGGVLARGERRFTAESAETAESGRW
jgi:hypothetical protein